MLAKKFTHGISFFVEQQVFEKIKKEAEKRQSSISAVIRDEIYQANFLLDSEPESTFDETASEQSE